MFYYGEKVIKQFSLISPMTSALYKSSLGTPEVYTNKTLKK